MVKLLKLNLLHPILLLFTKNLNYLKNKRINNVIIELQVMVLIKKDYIILNLKQQFLQILAKIILDYHKT
jgi:hypothetical protein